MKKTMIISALMLLLIGLLAAQMTPMRKHVPADPAKQFNPSFRDRPTLIDDIAQCKEELKLTDEQMKNLETLRNNFEKSRNTLQAEMDNLHIDIKTALKDENYARAKELSKQLNSKHGQMAESRIDFVANRMKELNPDQKKFMLQRMGQGKHHCMQPGMGMMHGQGRMNCCPDKIQEQPEGCGNCDNQGMEHGKDNPKPDPTSKQIKDK